MERKLERQAVKWLKEQGAYVVKLSGPGVPAGAPDRLFVYGAKWAAIEFKSSPTASYRPGQRETLDFLRRGNRFVYAAYPENWEEVKQDLIDNFFC